MCLLGTSITTIALPYSTMSAVDSAVNSEGIKKVVFFSILYLMAALISKILTLIANHLYLIISRKFITNLRLKICQHIIALDGTFFVNAKAGELYTVILEDVERIQGLAGKTIPTLIMQIFTAIPILVFLFMTEPFICMLLFMILPFIIFIQRIYLKKIQKNYNECRIKSGNSNSVLQEFLSQLMDVVFLKADKYFIHRLENKFEDVEKSYIKHGSVCYFRSFWLGLASVVSSAVIISVGGYWVSKKIITIGMVFAILQNYQTAMAPVIMFADFLASCKECSISLDRIFHLLDKVPYSHVSAKTKQHNIADMKEILYKGVSFSYQDDTYILNNITLKFEKGKMVALVGESGGGKTTLLNLLYCFWKPNSGSILVDGIDLDTIEIETFRNNTSVVSQNIVLFNDTIINNICLGDSSISRDKVMNVCRECGIDNFIKELPLGLETIVGERGMNLSGGQKQRIGIARALIKNASILLFDEATSVLDNHTECIIRDTILKYKKEHIIVVIAHRLSTIIDADKIYVMQFGKIVEEGKHKDLINKDGFYANLYSKILL